MACKDTLLIRHFPPELDKSDIEDLLSHFGAKSTKILLSRFKHKTKAYARFESEDIARAVLYRLHQLPILDSALCVEYAKEDIGCENPRRPKINEESKDNARHFKSFLNKLNAWNSSINFHQPPPSHLKYSYPKPNPATLCNIMHALGSVPKFYTQVLHLMNKMNLPPPFVSVPAEPVFEEETRAEEMSESESELESDPDEQKIKEIIPMKRTLPQKERKIKRPKFVKPVSVIPGVKVAQSAADVFETVNLQQKKIELKFSSEINVTQPDVENIEKIEMYKPNETIEDKIPVEGANEAVVCGKCITEKELSANRIESKDFNVLPVFKNYHQGAPSCRIYIKNLAKTVVVEDLEYIYRRYMVTENDGQGNMFDIRLMQEGRMKGQAFVTLQSVELAQKAVKETNGYILKEKPMVVVFARSAVPKQK